MNNQPNTTTNQAMKNTTTTMPNNAPRNEAYWKNFKRYIAKPDGSAEIHFTDGRIDRIACDGRQVRPRKGGEGRNSPCSPAVSECRGTASGDSGQVAA